MSIERRGDYLWLRAILPPKPHLTNQHSNPYQQRVSLGVRATPAGLQHAEQQAKLMGYQLDSKQFNWSDWMDEPDEDRETVASWLEKFERDHWSRVKRTTAAETTWKTDYLQVFSKLPSDRELSMEVLLNYIATTAPDSRNRKRACTYCYKFASFAGLEGKETIKEMMGNYSTGSVNPRLLPSDASIAQWRASIQFSSWRWVVGVLATYGLRGHEVFRLDMSDYPVVRVLEGKTGARFIYPLYPEWAEQWELDKVELPSLDLSYSNAKLGTKVAGWFYDRKAPFKAYDLRHAYARRCFEFNLAPDWAAGLMGHSLNVHLQTYRAWIDEAVYRKAYEAVINRSDRPTPP